MATSSSVTWTLITVTYNSSEVLKKYWGNLEWPSDVEWIVVDNASTDDSIALAETLGARVIRMTKNRGFGAANNVGFDHAAGTYIAFVNPDLRVDFDSLDSLRDILNTEDALVSPQLINVDGSLQANGRGLPFLIHKIQHRISPSKLDESYRLLAAEDEDRQVDWFIGAAVAGKKETFTALGPWDDHFFLYYEDADLCLRATKAGYKCIVSGRSRWIHGWQRETSSFKFQPWKRELASMTKFYLRYPTLLSLFPQYTSRRLQRKMTHATSV